MPEFYIDGRAIGRNHPPFLIAEMSANHNQSFDQALEIVRAAKRAGASAIKLQTYTPETLTIESDNADFLIDDEQSLWHGEYLYSLYSKAFTPWEWIEPIITEAKMLDLICFSSVFDESSVDLLESLNVSAYKIASFENAHLPLIRKAASTGKPLIISTGMATLEELEETVDCARSAGCADLILLKCTSNYPASPENSNLATIADMQNRFGCLVGLSDHTLGIGAAIASVALGAVAIEKHFTISRDLESPDSAFSSDEVEFGRLVVDAKIAWKAIGKVQYGPTPEEVQSVKFRRSIYAVTDIKSGEEFSTKNIRIIRPGFGLHPRHYDFLIGKTCKKNLRAGDRLDDLSY